MTVNNNLRFDVFRPDMASSDGVAPRKDSRSTAVWLEVRRLMAAHGMKQIELTRRAGEKQQRVHKFIKGQMPYPPMDFLDRLLQVFGSTLIEVLTTGGAPERPLPILRADVQKLADTVGGMKPEGVAAVQSFADTLQGIWPRDTPTAPAPSAPTRSTRSTNRTRASPKT